MTRMAAGGRSAREEDYKEDRSGGEDREGDERRGEERRGEVRRGEERQGEERRGKEERSNEETNLLPHHHPPATWPVSTVRRQRRALSEAAAHSGCTCPGFVPDKLHLEPLYDRYRRLPTFTAWVGVPRPPELEFELHSPTASPAAYSHAPSPTLAGASNRAGIAANGVGSTARVSGLAAVASGTIAGLDGGAWTSPCAPRSDRGAPQQPKVALFYYMRYAAPHKNRRFLCFRTLGAFYED